MLNKGILLNTSDGWKPSLVTETSRNIYRHDNGMGTVIEFDMYGTDTKLFVPDAKYRSSSMVNWGSLTSEAKSELVSELVPIPGSSFYIINGASYSHTTILSPIPTDAELQSLMPLSSVQSAKTCTDAIVNVLGDSTDYAAGLARSCVIDGLGAMDLPNFYELLVCWCEADNIDNIDPTAENYPKTKLGYTVERFHGLYYWSSSVHTTSMTNAWRVLGDGECFADVMSNVAMILPVLEL